MNLVLDIGNSLTKAAFFEKGKLAELFQKMDENALKDLVERSRPEALMVSSVANCPTWLLNNIEQHPHFYLLNEQTKLPFSNYYQTPKTLGADRLAAVAGAMSLYPNQPILAIDAGSCITYDMLDANQRYHGGSISPGVQMRCRAMHTFTARLPLVDINAGEQTIPLRGGNTLESLRSGAWHGTLAEINQMIRMYEDKFGDLQVVICGGDAAALSQELKAAHQWVPELILIGLNTILAQNVIS